MCNPTAQQETIVAKHPLAEAEHEYIEQHPEALDSTTLGSPSKRNQYLKNRLNHAFHAGWTAREAFEKRNAETVSENQP